MSDLRTWLEWVEALGQLQRVAAPVDWDEELGAITYLVASRENAPALLFENVCGHPGWRVLSNLIGSSLDRLALTLGLPPGLRPLECIAASRERVRRRLPPVEVAWAEAPLAARVWQGAEVDLTALPAPKFWPRDGGRYVGSGTVLITRHPETGTLNLGTYRQMLHGPREVGVYISPGKDGLQHLQAAWRRGEALPAVAVYGLDPLLLVVGSQSFGAHTSEYDVAGGIRGEPVAVVRGPVTGLPIPATAEIAVEGFLDPDALRREGPLGEFTGYYGRPAGAAPVLRVEALYCREQPILTAAMAAEYPICEQALFIALARAARLWDDLERLGVPGIRGVYAHPAAAAGFAMVVVSLEQRYAGHAAQVLALAAQAPSTAYYTKWIIAVDEDVDPSDLNQVLWALSVRCHPTRDIDLLRRTWSTPLDPSQNDEADRPYGAKVLINACRDLRPPGHTAPRALLREQTYRRVAARWGELGFVGAPPRPPALDPGEAPLPAETKFAAGVE
ncbi:MAG: UbiD family decarboxylase [Chloroflexi bacterium]|nr:UbiD family decarboxylase [Chloroflexota bacterium]